MHFMTVMGQARTTKEFEDYKLMPDYKENETCDFYEMEKRINTLVYEIIS